MRLSLYIIQILVYCFFSFFIEEVSFVQVKSKFDSCTCFKVVTRIHFSDKFITSEILNQATQIQRW